MTSIQHDGFQDRIHVYHVLQNVARHHHFIFVYYGASISLVVCEQPSCLGTLDSPCSKDIVKDKMVLKDGYERTV